MPVYVSDRLTATLGVVRGSPTPTRLIQWFRGSTTIAGANASTYTVTSDDIGQPISVRQTETNYFGSAVATSAATEDVEVFDPSILFSASEPGVWYDPTDAANLAWRRNLLLWTDSFSTAAWAKTSMLSFTNTATVAPDGTTSAVLVTELSGSTLPNLRYQNAPVISAGVMSVYAKSNGRNFVCLQMYGGTANRYASAVYDLSTGTVTKTQAGTSSTISSPSIVSVGSGWYRLSFAYTTSAPVVSDTYIQLCGSGTPTIDVYGTPVSYTGDGVSGTYLWGAQLEQSSTLTAYQPITDLNVQVITQSPNATLYQDVAGTIPVYAPEQPVGLMLDKSRGGPGPELVTNGNFSAGTTGWTPLFATQAVVSGEMEVTATGSSGQSSTQEFPVVSGRMYRVSGTMRASAANSVAASCRISISGSVVYGLVGVPSNGVQTPFSIIAVANASVFQLQLAVASLGAWGAIGDKAYFDNISVKELPGNHATQSTAISRPLYGIVPVSGRRNLLTYTEQFDNAAWTKASILSVAADGAAAPDGTNTADTVTEASGAAWHSVYNTAAAAVVSGQNHTVSLYVKAGTRRYIQVSSGAVGGSNQTNFGVVVDTSVSPMTIVATGNGTSGTYASSSIQSVGSGWHRVTVTGSIVSTAGYLAVSGIDSASYSANPQSSGSQTFVIWGAQLETSSTPTAYQKVTNDYDVTEAGVASVGYLRFDGTNDSMITSTITPGTNKAQVFAGVRKLSDAARGILAEFGTTSAINGSFTIDAPAGATATYRFGTFGTSSGVEGTATGFAAPITNVIQMSADLAGASPATQVSARINATTATLSLAGSTGGGSYGTYQMYLGRRAGTSLEFNGQLFPMIVRFGPNMSSALIRTTENWVASKTAGVVLS